MDWQRGSSFRGSQKVFRASIFTKEEQGISLIGEGISVTGTLHFGKGTVRLEGRWDGEMIGEGILIVGREARFHGEMRVGGLILFGRIEGTVIASDGAHIASTGKLLGTVCASRLVIEEGGILHGRSAKWKDSPMGRPPES